MKRKTAQLELKFVLKRTGKVRKLSVYNAIKGSVPTATFSTCEKNGPMEISAAKMQQQNKYGIHSFIYGY